MHDELITKSELRWLPRRACIAFAARCARRVQPLYAHFWPQATMSYQDAVDQAMEAAERYAFGVGDAVTADIVHRANDAAYAAADQAHIAYAAAERAATAHAKAAHIAQAAPLAMAGQAAHAAHAAALAAYDALATYDAAAAAIAAAHTAAAADYVDDNANVTRSALRRAMRVDFNRLAQTSRAESWNDETPVPPTFFGPLFWPEGVPEGWPTGAEPASEPTTTYESARDPAPPVALVCDPTVLTNDEYAKLYTLLGDLVREQDGVGVESVWEDESEVPVEVEVP